MENRTATAEDIREILDLMEWTVRDLASYWDCTEQAIYQWMRTGIVTRGMPTWCVRKTLEEARRDSQAKGNGRKPRLAGAR